MRAMNTFTTLTALVGIAGALTIPFAANLQQVRRTEAVAEAVNRQLSGPQEVQKATKPAAPAASQPTVRLDTYKP